jgi:hypothetical protein
MKIIFQIQEMTKSHLSYHLYGVRPVSDINPANWVIPVLNTTYHIYNNVPVAYCLAESAPRGCTVRLSFPILAAVIVCDAIKLHVIVVDFYFCLRSCH